MALLAHKNQTVREALAAYGVTPHFDVDALTEVLWRPIQVSLQTPAVHAFVDALIGGFYDAELGRSSGSL